MTTTSYEVTFEAELGQELCSQSSSFFSLLKRWQRASSGQDRSGWAGVDQCCLLRGCPHPSLLLVLSCTSYHMCTKGVTWATDSAALVCHTRSHPVLCTPHRGPHEQMCPAPSPWQQSSADSLFNYKERGAHANLDCLTRTGRSKPAGCPKHTGNFHTRKGRGNR